MDPSPSPNLGTALVVAQLGLIGALGLAAAPIFLTGRAPPAAWAVALAGVALGLWALACNRPGNFNIRPLPRPDGQLIRHGPYRFIRHPMYTAVLACALACDLALAAAWTVPASLALLAVLVVKAGVEERAMRRLHPDYARYQAGTRRFLPGLY